MVKLVTNEESSGKKKKKGFKVDRRENYLKMLAKKNGGKDVKQNKSIVREKSVVFDDKARREYLLTLHKKKNERRVQAFVDVKQKMKKNNTKTRMEQREEARKAYNKFARVPILPNYTYQIPRLNETLDDSSNESDEDEEKEESRAKQLKRAKRLALEKESLHSLPAEMTGSLGGKTEKVGGQRLDDDVVAVEVKPLFGKPENNPLQQGSNFADLPSVVEQELRRLRQESKGPARTKSKIHMLKELEKIRKIKKYSRKGHGKKSKSGKRKNRKK